MKPGEQDVIILLSCRTVIISHCSGHISHCISHFLLGFQMLSQLTYLESVDSKGG